MLNILQCVLMPSIYLQVSELLICSDLGDDGPLLSFIWNSNVKDEVKKTKITYEINGNSSKVCF